MNGREVNLDALSHAGDPVASANATAAGVPGEGCRSQEDPDSHPSAAGRR